ncbi:hypothetical protein ABVT39_011641 [Epinephelus coioides]
MGNSLLRDCMTAADWCSKEKFDGRLQLPAVVSMDNEEQTETLSLLQRWGKDYGDEDSPAELFTFVFEKRKDYDKFCEKLVDEKNYKVFARFEETEEEV